MKKELLFSSEIRKQVREEQNRCCGDCGIQERGRQRFQVHHKVPRRLVKMLTGDVDSYTLGQFKEHIKSRDNAILLCPKCHKWWDELSYRWVFFGFKTPLGIPMKEESRV